jgi:hypothetical protein
MAGNYIFRPAVIAILAICVAPVYAHSQQPDIAKLKAEAQNAFNLKASSSINSKSILLMLLWYRDAAHLRPSYFLERRAVDQFPPPCKWRPPAHSF